MLTLAAADTLAAGADAATTVTMTITGGMQLASATETFSVLYQGQLANSPATVYTVPASTQAFLRSISVVNTDTAASHQFQLFRGGTTAAKAITPLFTLPAGGMAVYEDGLGWVFYTASGQQLQSAYATISPLDNWGIASSKGETMDRNICVEANNAIGATGVLYLQAIWLQAGTVVSNISFCTATTAAGTPTHYLFGLYSGALALLATTADQTSTAWAANTLRKLAVVTPYTVSTTDLYYLGIMMTASTIVTLKGNTARTNGALAGTAPKINGTSSSGLTTTLPDPAGAITQVTTGPIWGCVT